MKGILRKLLLVALAMASGTAFLPRARAQAPRSATAVLHSSPAVADLDGDQRADVAVAEAQDFGGRCRHYRVQVHLSAEASSSFNVESRSADGLHIAALDVDGDDDLDLVISSQIGREPIGVWINDGHGGFSQGDAAGYPEFIWQRAAHFFEPPEHALAPVFCGCPASGWTMVTSSLVLRLPSVALRLGPPADRAGRTFLNPASRFRAPPLS